MAAQDPGHSRLPSLTGLRFGAAFLVFLCHSFVLGYFDPRTEARLAPTAFAIGWLGVEFFFILSGFVLTWSAREEHGVRRFWRRRLAKIYPNHVVTWCAAILLALWAGQSVNLGNLLPSLFLVHTWYPRLNTIVTINVVTWSLSCELLFYLAFPLLHALIRRIPPARLWWTLAALAAVILVLPAVARAALPGTPRLPGQDMSLTQNWFLVSFPLIRALDFTLGIVMARIVREGRWIRLNPLVPVALLVAGFAVQLANYPGLYSLSAPVAVPLALLVPAVAAVDLRGGRSVFRSRALVWLGTISYASYLTHFLVLEFGHNALGATRSWSAPVAVAVLAGMFALTTVVAWALHTLVEVPAMRLLGGARADRRRPTGAPPVPAPAAALARE
ncbi:acyltransferase [Kitasatospora sp. NBC_01287]|uniref:acyltransferase family protein n=1 Tax=Kitasatospora sp. NBC_01287 TaxID=2903573 RepID=UPI00224D0875|nr:acyltransferase [Kitasatospora sp. NBC_01287]MCX4751613.1 acyltransferase [Kitasatospora sp. NBC_01287]